MKKHLMVMGILMGMFFHAFSRDYPLRVWQFKPGEKIYSAPDQLLLESYGLAAPYGAVQLERQNKEKNGKQVYRLQQTYAGIPVENSVALIHVSNGYAERIIANWPETRVNISVIPAVTLEKAVSTAVEATNKKGAVRHKNKKGEAVKMLLWLNSGRWHLVYEVLVEIPSPFDIRKLRIDAHSGAVLSDESLGHHCCTPATAALNYRGTETILTDEYEPGMYRLSACIGASGGGDCTSPIATFRTVFADSFYLVDFTNPSTNWTGFVLNTRERCALDAHWGTKAVFDYYLNLTGFNENIFYGEEMLNILDSNMQNNASYIEGQSRIVYGHSPGTEQYWTSLDVVAHELTHQVTHANSHLLGNDEPGAINEAISDIYAIAISAHYGSGDWLIAGDFDTLRSFSHPNDYLQPDTYEGFYWDYTPVDDGGIHTNNGVINYWFYLLVNGGAGINDLGNPFYLGGIGMAEAISLMNDLQNSYLISTTDMHEMRRLAMIAAGERWGYCSEPYVSVVNAFYAVGIGAPFNIRHPIDETWETDLTSCSAILHWEDVGAEEYLVKYWAVNDPTNTFMAQSLINEVLIYNLLPGTVYEWEVSAQCAGPTIPASHTDTFETVKNCPGLEKLVVSDITTCSAELSWTETSAWQFRVDYQAQGTSGITTLWVAEPPAVLSGLLPNTTYTVWVTPYCGDSCSGNSDSLSFTTLSCPQLQNVKIDNNPCYFNMNWDRLEGQTYTIVYSYLGIDSVVLSAPVEEDFYGSYSFTHSFSPGTVFYIDITITCAGQGCTTQHTEHFGFVVPAETEECGAPSNITIHYSPDGAERFISWDGPANGMGWYNVEIVSSDGSIQTHNNWYGNSLVTFGPQKRCIRVMVQAICGCSDSTRTTGPWAAYGACPPCPSPGEIYLDEVCSDFAFVGFIGVLNALGYHVRYWPASDPGDISTLPDLPPSHNLFKLSNLAASTTYVVEVSTLCDEGEYSAPVYFEFTTDPEVCAVPLNPSYQLLSNDVIRLEWSAMPDAAYYEVDYIIQSTNSWTTVQVINNYLELPGLLYDDCVVYTARVRAICGNCFYGTSAYTPLFHFPDCVPPGLHIGMEAEQKCNPCEKDCYVCIVDAQGNKINTVANTLGYWYSIDWIVPSGYPVPGPQLHNRECIDMGPGNTGQLFRAFVRRMCNVNGYQREVCSVLLTYIHTCEREGGEGGGTIGLGGHLADGNHAGSVDMEQQAVFSIYPNPGSHDLNLVNRSESGYIGTIQDAYGRSLKTIQAGAGSTITLTTAEWPAGVYYIRMKMPDGTHVETLKWVKL